MVGGAEYRFPFSGALESLFCDAIGVQALQEEDQWRSFFCWLCRHRLASLFLTSEQGSRIDPAVRPDFEQHHRENAERNLAFVLLIRRLQKLLNPIPYLIVKGIPLTESLYGDFGLRRMKDIDLLIRAEDVAEASWRVEATLDFAPTDRWPEKHLRLVMRAKNERVFTRAGLAIELHWRLSPHKELFPNIDPGGSEATGHQVVGKFGSAPVLPHALNIAYLAYHGAKHQWYRLIWLIDLLTAVAQIGPDQWGSVLPVIEEYNQERTLAIGLAVGETLFQVPVPEEIDAWYREQQDIGPLAEAVCERLRRTVGCSDQSMRLTPAESYQWTLRLERSPLRRMRVRMRLLFQPQEADLERTDLPAWLGFLYYPVRLWRLLFFRKRAC